MLLADTHVHLYRCYDLEDAFDSAFRKLAALRRRHKLAPDDPAALFLTERADHHVFRDLKSGERFSVEPIGENLLEVRHSELGSLYLAPGRQIITAERLEILALTVDMEYPDGKPIREVIAAVREAGGVPVLPWSPGKWFSNRGKIVREIIQSSEKGTLLLGDTTLRPLLWGEPRLMREGRERGLTVVAGSDPLPFAGEERYIGSYGSLLDGPFDRSRPLSSLRDLLRRPAAVTTCGRRLSPFVVFLRLQKNRKTATKKSQ